MALNEKYDEIKWPVSNYLFLEKTGPFQETAPACWQEFHKVFPQLLTDYPKKAVASLYKVSPTMLYRAGMMTDSAPSKLPDGVRHEKFQGGKYIRFTLTGSFSQLPEACGKVFEIVKAKNIALREDFYIENYVTDPRVTPEDQLVTEILVPVK